MGNSDQSLDCVKTDDILRAEIADLAEMLGCTIEKIAGSGHFETVETIRRLTRDRRNGNRAAETSLDQLMPSLDNEQLRVVIREQTVVWLRQACTVDVDQQFLCGRDSRV